MVECPLLVAQQKFIQTEPMTAKAELQLFDSSA